MHPGKDDQDIALKTHEMQQLNGDLPESERPPKQALHLLYHELQTTSSSYSYVVETGSFERHLDLYLAMRRTAEVNLFPELTFDDGHISNFEQALPCLQSRELTARFFITAGWTGTKAGYMGWNELRRLHEAGQPIGAHGLTHTLLTHCDENQLRAELVDARSMLEDGLGASITTMSLPGGRSNRRVLEACQEAGYDRIYTSVPKPETLPLSSMVGRLNIRGDMTLEWISQVLQPESGILRKLGRLHEMKAVAKKMLGDHLYERLWALVNKKDADTAEGDAA
jgi:Polysaccharide deacetylase